MQDSSPRLTCTFQVLALEHSAQAGHPLLWIRVLIRTPAESKLQGSEGGCYEYGTGRGYKPFYLRRRNVISCLVIVSVPWHKCQHVGQMKTFVQSFASERSFRIYIHESPQCSRDLHKSPSARRVSL